MQSLNSFTFHRGSTNGPRSLGDSVIALALVDLKATSLPRRISAHDFFFGTSADHWAHRDLILSLSTLELTQEVFLERAEKFRTEPERPVPPGKRKDFGTKRIAYELSRAGREKIAATNRARHIKKGYQAKACPFCARADFATAFERATHRNSCRYHTGNMRGPALGLRICPGCGDSIQGGRLMRQHCREIHLPDMPFVKTESTCAIPFPGGRRSKLPCIFCGELLGSTAMTKHKCEGVKNAEDLRAAGTSIGQLLCPPCSEWSPLRDSRSEGLQGSGGSLRAGQNGHPGERDDFGEDWEGPLPRPHSGDVSGEAEA